LNDEIYSKLAVNQMLVDIEVILKNKPKKINMGDCDDAQLEKVLEMSKKEFGNLILMKENSKNNQNSNYNEEDFNQFLYEDNTIPPSVQNDIEDDLLKQALELSLNEMVENLKISLPQEPAENNSNAINLVLKEGSNTFMRRFNKQDKVRDVKNYLAMMKRTFNEIELSENLPKKTYSNENLSLEEAGIVNNCVLCARVIQ
jgi:hypothetical protein